MIVAFTGTRNCLTAEQHNALEQQISLLAPDEVHHGDCVGADAVFDTLCRSHRCVIHIHPSTVESHRAGCPTLPPVVLYSPLPPLERNKIMVAASDILLATPATQGEVLRSGTWATIRYARKLCKRVVVISPSGAIDDSGVTAQSAEDLIRRKRAMIAEAFKKAKQA